jgi:spermidine synthase
MQLPIPISSPRAALLALGATAVVTQIILLREFLAIFHGNELVIGIVLACWLILTGAGALLGRRARRSSARGGTIPSALLALGLIPLLTVFLLRFLRNIVFTAGSMVPIVQAFIAAGVLLAPFCVVSGFTFVLFTADLSARAGRNPVALAYFWESLGSAAAGLLFSLFLLPSMETFQGLSVLLMANAALAYAFAVRNHARALSLIAAAGLIAGLALLMFGNLDLATRRFLFPGQTVAFFRDTPYGNLTVTRQEGQVSLFENGVLMFSTGDVTANEENVHYAMAQRSSPRHVLLIGGGIAGTTVEVLKYGVERVDYAEMNPWILRIGREFTDALKDQRIHAVNDDGRRYVRTTALRYDVALINLPDPETIQLNRFYTVEFFRELKRALNDNAVVSISLLPAAEYQGPEARRSSSILYATLHRSFANVLVVPGSRNYFLASDGPLDIRIGKLMEKRGVATTYVNRYYLDDRMLEQRSAEIMRSFEPGSPVNTDFEPISYYHQLDYWLSYFGAVPAVWLLLVLAAILLLAWRFSAVGVGIFVGGFVAVSLEILLLLVVQTLSGSLFYMTGIVIAAFMAGMAAGSLGAQRFFPNAGLRAFAGLQFGVGVVCILLPLLFAGARRANMSADALQMLFSLLAFSLAVLFGMEFALASSVKKGTAASAAAELYGLDLAGSALGALMISVYAIPIFGVADVGKLLGWASAAAAALCLAVSLRKKG